MNKIVVLRKTQDYLKTACGGLMLSILCWTGDLKAQGVQDVEWCLHGDADSRMDQQPARGYCPGFWVGGVLAAIYQPDVLAYISGIQREWAARAATMSCARNPQSDAIAVSLIAACQCHNTTAANWVAGNPGPVLNHLRQSQGC